MKKLCGIFFLLMFVLLLCTTAALANTAETQKQSPAGSPVKKEVQVLSIFGTLIPAVNPQQPYYVQYQGHYYIPGPAYLQPVLTK